MANVNGQSGHPCEPPVSPAPPPRSLSSATPRSGQPRRCVFCAFASARWPALSAHYTEVHNVAKVAAAYEEVSSAELEPGCSSMQTRGPSMAEAVTSELSPASSLQRKRARSMGMLGGGGGGAEAAGKSGETAGEEGAEEGVKTRKLDSLQGGAVTHGENWRCLSDLGAVGGEKDFWTARTRSTGFGKLSVVLYLEIEEVRAHIFSVISPDNPEVYYQSIYISDRKCECVLLVIDVCMSLIFNDDVNFLYQF